MPAKRHIHTRTGTVILAIAALVAAVSITAVTNADTLSPSADAGSAALLLSGFEAPLENDWALNPAAPALSPETRPEFIKEGKTSARWENLPMHSWLNLKPGNPPADWSAYEAISIWINAEKANGQVINFTAGSSGTNGEGDYFIAQVTVDWTGWKQVIIPLERFIRNRSPKGWNAITGFQIAAKGWGGVQALPDTVLWLDHLQLIRR
ncbi:sugar-binding protein [Opitutaceae bacterium TAV5]|nr:sugar-binding protein [Opitutaceae bacterium TAV5]